ncbi:hypothetical protein CCYA_CCYA08G2384 [Cyanidiococcus yangmingshanensis]|nr:hypothetical protein CCYA_CCYA08G2384 [Cyanidiococcus yangmingshanensis]
MALRIRLCSRQNWLLWGLITALTLAFYDSWGALRATATEAVRFRGRPPVLLGFPHTLLRAAPTSLELNSKTGICENQTHCLCGVHRVRMLSLYPDSRRPRSVTAQRNAASCVLRPRGARVSYRCACEGTGICRKLGRKSSTQPAALALEDFSSQVLSQRTGYWTTPCNRREGEALELICS